MLSGFEYFFYEWLIIVKKIDEERFQQLTVDEFKKLKIEFIEFNIKNDYKI